MKGKVYGMKVEQVLELVKAVSESDLTEFKYEEDGVKLSLKKTCDRIVPVAAPTPVAVAASGIPGAAPAVIPAASVPAAPAPAPAGTAPAETPAAATAAARRWTIPSTSAAATPPASAPA